MAKRRGPPSQGWRTFLRNHAPDIAVMDLFVVPTIGFRMLYGFVIVRLDRRYHLDQRHNQPDGGVGRTSDNRGVLVRFSEPVWSGHALSWADFITTTPELKFSVQTACKQFWEALNDETAR